VKLTGQDGSYDRSKDVFERVFCLEIEEEYGEEHRHPEQKETEFAKERPAMTGISACHIACSLGARSTWYKVPGGIIVFLCSVLSSYGDEGEENPP
jgi:hypothetical protein